MEKNVTVERIATIVLRLSAATTELTSEKSVMVEKTATTARPLNAVTTESILEKNAMEAWIVKTA